MLIGRTLALAAGALGLVVCTAACSNHPTKPNWKLAWSDEFDGPAGQLPDSRNWAFDVGTDWGNGQLEYDTSRPENVSLDGAGNLAITAILESYVGRAYTSGRIKTSGLFSQNGGRFEARMRLPSGQGMWPAFWLLGADYVTKPWPACGEIDIMENRGQEPTLVHGSLHGPGYSGGHAITRAFTVPGAPLDATFHVYAVEWSSSKITWSVDGLDYAMTTAGDLPGDAAWVFNHPFFIILNLAVGGSYVGPPGVGTTFPQRLLVDYVRVYRRH
jgi:beta-glucanase (GH16 family)